MDSGAARSIMPKEMFDKHFSKNYGLEPTVIKLKLYDCSVIEPNGQFEAHVDYQTLSTIGNFLIVDKGTRTLIGRDLIKSLGFFLQSVHLLDTKDSRLNDLIRQFPDLYDGSLGCFKGEPVDFKLKTDAKPVFCKPRPIPFALREKVNSQIGDLVNKDILEKVDFNEWGTPLVPVLKENGAIRICGDYKVTTNPVLEDVQEPIPRIEEIFANLGGGIVFTKLDLSWAYNQVPVTPETAKLLAWSTDLGTFLVKRLSFGPKSAVPAFQQRIRKTLQGAKGTSQFLDDIIVTG